MPMRSARHVQAMPKAQRGPRSTDLPPPRQPDDAICPQMPSPSNPSPETRAAAKRLPGRESVTRRAGFHAEDASVLKTA